MRNMLGGAAIAFALVACGGSTGAGTPQQTAEKITRAVYANDLDTTIASFDDATKKTITRSDLGELSDRMHVLGEFKSITQRSANVDTGKYEFDAAFANGSMLVELRVDPSGKVGAYRVVPEAAGHPSSAAPAG